MSQRHTITEAKDSVDRLYALVEKHFKNMLSRVQALELRGMQREDHESLEDDSESLATIHAPPSHLSSEESIDGFDFSDELQRSRVYRRTQPRCQSSISALTKGAHSLGWSFVSGLSTAEVSDISAIHLAITEGEVFNPGRPSQTWSAQLNPGVSTNDHIDGQRTQPNKVFNKDSSAGFFGKYLPPLPASRRKQQQDLSQTHTPSSQLSPVEDPDDHHHPKDSFEVEESANNAENLDRTFVLPPPELSEPQLPLQAQASAGRCQGQDEIAYSDSCEGCGEVGSIPLLYSVELSRS